MESKELKSEIIKPAESNEISNYKTDHQTSEKEFVENIHIVDFVNNEIQLDEKAFLDTSKENNYEDIMGRYANNYNKNEFEEDVDNKVSENLNLNEFDFKISDNNIEKTTSSSAITQQRNEKNIENTISDLGQDSFMSQSKNDLLDTDDELLICKEPSEIISTSLKLTTEEKRCNDDDNESLHSSPKRNEKFISSEDLLADFVKPNTTKHDEIFPELISSKDVNSKNSPESSEVPPKLNLIQVEEIFYKFGLDMWFRPNCLHPKVESLIYWRDVKKSGVIFGAGLTILLAISCYSVISVVAYLSLIGLTGSIVYRIQQNVMSALQKTSGGHPFKEYLDLDINVSQEKMQHVCNIIVAHLNAIVSELRRLFLVADLVDSFKFGVILWIFTYVGSWFNGMTLVILAFISTFSLPKVYEQNKQIIDQNLDTAKSKLLEITDKVKAAVPIGKKSTVPEKEE